MEQFILQEIKEMRTLLTTGQSEIGERLARIETQMSGIVGNGRPGRIDRLEEAIETLKAVRWKQVGLVGGISSVIPLIVMGLDLYFKHRQ